MALLGVSLGACFVANSYELYIVATTGLTTIIGVGLNILFGLSGQVSLGHAGFYAIGAYTVAVSTVTYGASFWLALPLAMLLTGLVGIGLALPAVRVTGPALAMVTIAFGFIIEHGAVEWKGLTGGANGLMHIPLPAIFGYAFVERDVALLIVLFTSGCLYLYWRLRGSAWGLALRAVRDSEVAAASLGLNPVLIRTVGFALSAMAAGLAGALFAPLTSFVSPDSFTFFQSIMFLLAVIIGGAGTVFGPLVGAVIVVVLPELLAALAEHRLLVFGALLFVVLRLTPAGVVGMLAALQRRLVLPQRPHTRADVLAFLTPARPVKGLSVAHLRVAFGGVHAVESVSLAAHPGQITSLIGPNGAGKTTVLNLMCGLCPPDAGTVLLGTENVTGLPPYRISRAGLARTYQTTQLFAQLSVLDNLLIALRRGQLGSLCAALTLAPRDQPLRHIAEALLAFVGYSGAMHLSASALPHVDRRLVEIARALATQPRVVLLDEPAAGLGAQEKERLGELLRHIADAGLTVILVEHDMTLVMRISDEVVVLETGRDIAAGTPAVVRNNPAVRAAYFGEGGTQDGSRSVPWSGPLDHLLRVEQLSAAYNTVPVLDGITLAVHSGELITVLGANGAGKSTLMRALSGLHRPVTGRICLGNQDVTAFAAPRLVAAGLVLVPEGRQVFPDLSVEDNLRLGAYARAPVYGDTDIEGMFAQFPQLRARRLSRAGLLSGGEQQMLALARGLLAMPRILLLDEPSLGLAPTLVHQLFAVLAELRDAGTTIVLVDQRAMLALSVADRGYVLASGQICREGPAAVLRTDPALERAYLGTFD
jgi:ABC-type branched-subunit amino acid transport system ATPase component/ABC-type branched-subunit amino acid transport system permease subunit